MNFMKGAVVLAAFCFCACAKGQGELNCYHDDKGAHERSRNIDVTHMLLNVGFEPEKGLVKGTVTHTFLTLQDNVDTVFLDGPGITVSSASLDGRSIKFRTSDKGVTLVTDLKKMYGTAHSLKLEYTATPKRGIYFIGWDFPEVDDKVHKGRRQIWTQGQGIDNRHWIPMIDDRSDKFITEVFVKFQADYNVLSNGDLIDKRGGDNNNIWHYKINNQHSGYLLMLAIDKYAVKQTKTKRGTPINFWYYPEHPERLEPSSMFSERIIEFLEEETGVPYAWGAYSQVMIQDFLYGAMENTGATTFGDFFWVDSRAFLDRNYIGVNAHEATHQWFGDLITARNDADHWLQESFATFYPGLFQGSVYGADEQAWYYRGSMNGALAAGEKNSLPVRHSESGSGRHYPKGASVLYMLYHELGRENFRRGIQLYLDRYKFQGVVTQDLQKAFMDATGINTDRFFDQWIYRGGEPTYKVSRKDLPGAVEFSVEQTHKLEQSVGYFSVPVNFALYFEDGSVERRTVIVDKGFQNVILANPGNKKVSFALFDEGSYVLKKVTFEKSLKEWKDQLLKAPEMLDRYDALMALASHRVEDKKEALLQALNKESFRVMRAEIVKQLAPTADAAFLRKQYGSPMVDVRKALIENAPLNAETEDIFKAALEDSSYALIETALGKLWTYKPGEKSQMLDRIKDLWGYTHGLKIKYLELSTEVYPESRAGSIGTLTQMAGPQYEFRTRILAAQALGRLNVLDEHIAGELFAAVLNFNGRLSGPVSDVLKNFNKQSAYSRILKSAIEKGKYSEAEKEKLRAALGA